MAESTWWYILIGTFVVPVVYAFVKGFIKGWRRG